MSKKHTRWHYAWVILIAMCIIRSLSASALNNTGGLFLKPVADELQVGVGTLSIYFSISSIATLCFMPIGGTLIQRYSMRLLLCIAIILQCGAFLLFGFLHHVWAWYILAVPLGIGSALIVNLAGPILISRWFAKGTGKALGILMACAGLSGVFIQPFAAQFIDVQGWRSAYQIIGGFVLIILIITTLVFIRNKPEDSPYGAERVPDQSINKTHSGIPLAEARRNISFYALLLFMVAITAFGAFNQHMATYGASLAYTSAQVGTILSVGMLGSTLGAIVIGICSDKIGVYKTALIILIIAILSAVALMLGNTSFYLFALGSFLMGLGAMGIPVLAPLLTKTFFGERDYESIYSNIMMGPPFATVLLLPLYGFIYDLTKSYRLVILLLIGIIVVGFGAIMIASRKRMYYEK